MRNKKLIKANEQMLERQLKRGFSPRWYVVYHLNDGLISRHQQRRRLNPDEVVVMLVFISMCCIRWFMTIVVGIGLPDGQGRSGVLNTVQAR